MDTKKLIEVCEKLREALIWCSGSPDFGPGGQAEEGWKKLCRPAIDEAGEAIDEAK